MSGVYNFHYPETNTSEGEILNLKKFIIFFCFYLILQSIYANNELKVSTYNYGSNIRKSAHHISPSGQLVETFNCASKGIFKNYSFQFYPRKRALNAFTRGKHFALIPHITLTKSNFKKAHFSSSPVGIERWFLFSKKKIKSLGNAFNLLKIGVIRGSLQEEYIREKGIEPFYVVDSVDSLYKAMEINRIDGFISSMQEFNNINKVEETIYKKLLTYSQIRVKFSADVSKNNLKKFNKNISNCVSANFDLEEKEKTEVINFAKKVFDFTVDKKNRDNLSIINTGISKKEIRLRDKIWIQRDYSSDIFSIKKLLNSSSSELLINANNKWNNKVTEIFLHGPKGELIATSQLISDYNQSDEKKHSKIFVEKKKIYVSKINYDKSTRFFQVQVTFPVIGNKRLIAALTIGVNIEQLLTSLN
jgi:hypothetical protein